MEILELLSAGKSVSGEIIARKLKISRAAVHKRVTRLRDTGYAIEGEKNVGYRLVSRPDRILPEEINRHLDEFGTRVNGVRCFPSMRSTQTLAKELAWRGEKEWSLVVAEKQTGSYGRFQRTWVSPCGGLWFSLILRPLASPDCVPPLTLVASLALCRAIEREVGLRPGIKWPNDLLIDGKKIAGILTEMSAEVGRVNWVVIGIGLNVNNSLSRTLLKEAGSLRGVLGRPVDRCRLLAAFILEMGRLYRQFLAGGFGAFAREYNGRLMLVGKDVSIDTGERVVTGRVEQVDGDGHLRLKTPAGGSEKIVVGNVTILKRIEGKR
jgi:BirA family biotin operon repressor/biotin-[acetyl-CoA-carboxylase] ligase